ncbi:MAG TPA: Npt1/Npt2 family nucleotide transporter, partial [Vicinamibacterales bacterium]|nr:Npt1/Npt2 family nucleotide transporter [Vicinamibacterales bacterium]
MNPTFLRRILTPFVDLRDEESVTATLMFFYSFLAMTAYNIIQPLTRSKLITSLGAVNVPYVVFGSGIVIGFVMVGYTRLYGMLPKRWALSITQASMAAMMLVFWELFRTKQEWVSVAFYLWGLLLGVLLISQFWTLANGIYDPRQAKRLFGFIGGGVALGGMSGAGITALIIQRVGENTLLLWSAFTLVACAAIVSAITGRADATAAAALPGEERGITIQRAFALLRASRQVQLIALVIAFGSIGAALIDQQVNMTAEMTDNAGKFLAQIRFGLSAAAFVIQVWLTPRIHGGLGIGFALLLLPTNLGATAAATLLTMNVWAPAVATIMDRSLRYTVDKTTREVLFMPLPSQLRQEVKPFVDVTVDRVSRGFGAILILILIQPWGFHMAWYQLSGVSLGLTVAWFFMAIRAKREYLLSFRQSIARHDLEVDAVRGVDVGDLSTIETLVEELASADEARVIYAIDILESIGKRNLITPLLLHHESAKVRTRTLVAMEGASPELGDRWILAVERALTDADYDVRTAAVRTLAMLRRERAAELMRPYLEDKDPRLVITAAIALAGSPDDADVAATELALRALTDDTHEAAAETRREVARAMPSIRNPRLHQLLIPLFYDPDVSVALEAIKSAGVIGPSDALFVPPLVSLLRHRLLKAAAREVLVGYGESIVDVMGHFLQDQ